MSLTTTQNVYWKNPLWCGLHFGFGLFLAWLAISAFIAIFYLGFGVLSLLVTGEAPS